MLFCVQSYHKLPYMNLVGKKSRFCDHNLAPRLQGKNTFVVQNLKSELGIEHLTDWEWGGPGLRIAAVYTATNPKHTQTPQ